MKIKEENKSGDEGLHDWFNKSRSSDGKKGWVQLGGKYAGKPCARQPGQTSTPKCGSSKMARNMSPEEEERARKRKNRLDPNQPEKSGAAKPTNVRTESMKIQEAEDQPTKGSGKKDACYHKVKSRYDVWPSAYASGALVKCRKVGASNWGNKQEEMSVGSLSVKGLGASPGDLPGVSPRQHLPIIKRFAGNPVFKVNSEMYSRCLQGKKKYARYESYVGNDEVGQAIREFAYQNPGQAIIVEDEITGMMTYLTYGKSR